MIRHLLFLMMFGFTSVIFAETLVDAEALKQIESVLNWPVVDVRELSERSQSPIPGALDLDSELSIEGKILIVASDNVTAISAARTIEKKYKTAEVFVVDGGLETLRIIRPELQSFTDEWGMPETFNIPSDTCAQGDPLHTFTDEDE